MERKKRKCYELLDDTDNRKVEHRINELTEEHEGCECEVDYKDGRWIAICSWTVTEIDESTITIKDKYHLEGITYTCKNCPYMVNPEDKRIKRCECPFSEFGTTHKDHECCDLFYTELSNHKIIPVE